MPLSKAEQEAEAGAAGLRQDSVNFEAIEEAADLRAANSDGNESLSPAPAPIATEPNEQGEPVEKAEPTPVTDPRAEIARRFAEKRAKDREQYHAHEAEPTPLFLQEKPEPATEPVVEPTPAPAPAPAAPTYEIKVNGETAKVSREQLLAMADLSAEEAEGQSDKTLIKAAQITEAARRRLEAAKNTPFGTASTPAVPAATPAANQEPTAVPGQEQPKNETPSFREKLEKIQYGSPEEAEAAFEEAVSLKLDQRSHADRMRQVQKDQDDAIAGFGQKFTDLASHEEAPSFILAKTTDEVINDLRKIGGHEPTLIELRTNPDKLYQAHREARAAGLNVRTPAEILDAVGNSGRRLFGLVRETSQQQPSSQPAPAPTNSRLDAKRQLTQQPQRSGNPVAPAAPAPERSRSTVIQQMRQRRGQPVA